MMEPPPYDVVEEGDPGLEVVFLSLFTGADSEQQPGLVHSDQVLGHLKLLECLYRLREAIMARDGLFGIYNEAIVREPGASYSVDASQQRWAVYVQRAVDRFESWWIGVCRKNNPLMPSVESLDMHSERQLHKWGLEQRPLTMLTSDLPPIDVLMVWYAYILSPRTYLEDCLRTGTGFMWATPMPWKLINDAIDPHSYLYEPPDLSQHKFEKLTGLNWAIEMDSCIKKLMCPFCQTENDIPWFKVGPHGIIDQQSYAYRDMRAECRQCSFVMDHSKLCAVKFATDLLAFQTKRVPLPGMLLDLITNLPTAPSRFNIYELLDDKQLYKSAIKLVTLPEVECPLQAIKELIESKVEQYMPWIRETDSRAQFMEWYSAVFRRIFSSYWGNHSLFSRNLVPAVFQQATFIDQMHSLGWLFSPTLRNTATRAIGCYYRFLNLAASNKSCTSCVPTAEVDLVWHTHMLSPQSYYQHMVRDMGFFLNHDDSLSDRVLDRGLEFTAGLFQNRYSTPYFDCLCWYCESSKAVTPNPRPLSYSKFKRRKAKPSPVVFFGVNRPIFTMNADYTNCIPGISATFLSPGNWGFNTGACGRGRVPFHCHNN